MVIARQRMLYTTSTALRAHTKRQKEDMLLLTSKTTPKPPASQGSADFGTRLGRPVIEFDKAAEAKLRLKIDLYIVPTAFLLYLFCFIDRTNIGESI